jgi:hypothetical protein
MMRAGVVGFLLLAGCQSVTSTSMNASSETPDSVTAVDAANVDYATNAVGPPVDIPPAAEMPAPSVVPLPPPPVADEQKLVALDVETLSALLPAPSFERRDGAVRIVQHRNAYCIMDLYFYEAARGEAAEGEAAAGERLRHIDMRFANEVPGIGLESRAREDDVTLDRSRCIEAFFPDSALPEMLLADHVDKPDGVPAAE